MRIDAHHHLWNLGVRNLPWIRGEAMAAIKRDFDLEDLAPLAGDAGIDRTVVVQSIQDVGETRDLLALTARETLPAGVVGWVDLCDPGVADVIAALRAGPGGGSLVGVRHGVQGEPDPRWLCRPRVRTGLAALGGASLAYDLLIGPRHLPAAIDTVRVLGSLTFVVDHLAQPPIAKGELAPWAGLIRTLAAEPNTYCKLSGLVTAAAGKWSLRTLRPFADVVLDAFGPERVMFGSDWPVCLLAASYNDVVETANGLVEGLTPTEREAVFGGTAIRAYALRTGDGAPHAGAARSEAV
jgi:L-fuconolactonase